MRNTFKQIGVIALVAIIGFGFAALSLTSCGGADGGGGSDYIPPENKPDKDRWSKWEASDSTATLVYSVNGDGVCTITVGGKAESGDNNWKVSPRYSYTAKADKSYAYKFKAWTKSGTRGINVQYYYDYDNGKDDYIGSWVSLTNEPKEYTVWGEALPKGGIRAIEFQCANQLGTFYVKMLEIKEYILTPSSGTFTSIADMAAWLNDQPANNAASAHTIELNISGNLGGDINTPGSVGYVLKGSGKYVNLDLSGSTITSIEDGAFWVCTSLTNITIPNSVTNIGETAFYYCESLTAINVNSGNTDYSSDQGVLYNKSKTTLIQYPEGKTGNSFVIPNNVTSIGDYAFINCNRLTSITIPNSVTNIGKAAFNFSTSLTSVTIPNSVTNIGEAAFGWSGGLTAINVASDNTNYSSDQGVLYDKNKTTLVQYPAGKTDISFVIPNSVTSIGEQAFSGCENLTSVTLPTNASFTTIEYGAFISCGNLTSITIPNSVTSIGGQAFAWCGNLTSITIPNSITSINYLSFQDCTSLTSVIFEGTISADDFAYDAFSGDLREKFYADDADDGDNGTPGTYKTTAPVNENSTWTKQP